MRPWSRTLVCESGRLTRSRLNSLQIGRAPKGRLTLEMMSSLWRAFSLHSHKLSGDKSSSFTFQWLSRSCVTREIVFSARTGSFALHDYNDTHARAQSHSRTATYINTYIF